jgi:putative PIN family toxin of toxin-antitoxin system
MTARAVFDCMVFLQGAGKPHGPAGACFRLVDEGKVTLCVSAEVLAEVRDVLTRPRTLQRFGSLSPNWVEEFVQSVESKAVTVTEVPKVIALERDPKDEPYLNLAVAANASFLVTRDKDLLDLMTEEAFRERHPGLTILDPVAFLQAMSPEGQTTRAEGKGPTEGSAEPG